MSSYYKKGLIILAVVLFIASAFLGKNLMQNDENSVDSSFEIVEDCSDVSKLPDTESKDITVDVSGAVVEPGVYTLQVNSRVEDALDAAGGFSDEADKIIIEKKINRAKIVHDGEKIYIPRIGDDENELSYIENSTGIVNINVAGKNELETLTGIGEVYAERIIEYRKTSEFKTKEQIKNVNGIGDCLYDKIKDYITVK